MGVFAFYVRVPGSMKTIDNSMLIKNLKDLLSKFKTGLASSLFLGLNLYDSSIWGK
jgi:hypothetical protein